MKFRIGINLGDVIVEGERLYGDGVNVAARLEALAEPGGICISSKVFEEVRNKLEVGFEDLGEQEVKNITEPVRVYRVKLDGDGPRPESSASDPSRMQQEIRFCTTLRWSPHRLLHRWPRTAACQDGKLANLDISQRKRAKPVFFG